MSSGSGGKPSSLAAGSGSSGSISSSFLGLKAELERSKASTSSSASSSKRKSTTSSRADDLDSRKPKKLSSAFLDTSSNKKTKRSAAASDAKGKRSLSHDDSRSGKKDPSSSQLDKIRANMERKARIYDQLQAGKYAGFTTAELREGSIDWERKRSEPRAPSRSPSPAPGQEADEPLVEWEDEFGRTRTSRLSSVPREFLPVRYGGDGDLAEKEDDDNAIYGPATSFPVYDPGVHRSRRAAEQKQVERHFDPDFDKRHRGAGFYRFSDKEGERQAQLDQLAELRRETVRRREGREGDRRQG